VNALHAQRELLAEYFMRITPEGCVETLPRLLRRYTPNLDRLPLFLLRIALQVRSFAVRILRDRR
jgi:DNA mismatch repair protein MLH1